MVVVIRLLIRLLIPKPIVEVAGGSQAGAARTTFPNYFL